jgi:hypothetical protein
MKPKKPEKSLTSLSRYLLKYDYVPPLIANRNKTKY